MNEAVSKNDAPITPSLQGALDAHPLRVDYETPEVAVHRISLITQGGTTGVGDSAPENTEPLG